MPRCITSAYSRRGEVWRTYQKALREGRLARARRPSGHTDHESCRAQETIDQAYEDDPVAAAAEYGSEFRTHVESFVSHEAVGACLIPKRLELAPRRGVAYRAFCDPP